MLFLSRKDDKKSLHVKSVFLFFRLQNQILNIIKEESYELNSRYPARPYRPVGGEYESSSH